LQIPSSSINVDWSLLLFCCYAVWMMAWQANLAMIPALAEPAHQLAEISTCPMHWLMSAALICRSLGKLQQQQQQQWRAV
jgi:hypothetical protein